VNRLTVATAATSLAFLVLGGCAFRAGAEGPSDGGTPGGDAGPIDAGPIDAGPIDAGPIDAGSVDAGPVDGGCCSANSDGGCCRTQPFNHRVKATACAPSADGGITGRDGGGCSPFTGVCEDQCLTDADCGAGYVCSCAGQTFGYSERTTNFCVEASCETDVDCGSGGFCSPSVGDSIGNFYGIQSYECHGCADCCVNDIDCGATSPGKLGQPYCAYSPELGHWACGNASQAG
jgi:hypothetical protein